MTQPVARSEASIATFQEQLRIIDVAVKRNLDGITHDESLQQPQPAGNCINWVLGHLVRGFQPVLAELGSTLDLADASLERYRRGQPPIQDASEALDFEDLVRAWDASVQSLTQALDALSGRDLDPELASPTPSGKASLRSRLAFTLFHQAYHAGQLGTLRRLVGKDGAIP